MDKDEPAIYQELLEVIPESALGLLGLGKVRLFEKDLTQAEELLRKGKMFCFNLPIVSQQTTVYTYCLEY